MIAICYKSLASYHIQVQLNIIPCQLIQFKRGASPQPCEYISKSSPPQRPRAIMERKGTTSGRMGRPESRRPTRNSSRSTSRGPAVLQHRTNASARAPSPYRELWQIDRDDLISFPQQHESVTVQPDILIDFDREELDLGIAIPSQGPQ